MSVRPESSRISTTRPYRLTWRYQSSSNTVRLTFGSRRIHRSRLRDSLMLTRTRPPSQSYQVTTVMGNPSGRMHPITAAFGFLRNLSTAAGSVSAGKVLLHRKRRLPPVRHVVDLDRDDPLHPPESTAVGSDEAGGKPVAGIERRASKARREQQRAGLAGSEAAGIAQGRDAAGGRRREYRAATGGAENRPLPAGGESHS